MRQLLEFGHTISHLSLPFQCFACGLRVASSSTEPRWQQCSNAIAAWAKQHNDDLEDRAIGAAGNHGFYAKRAYEGGGGRGVEGALCYGLPKHRFGLTRSEAGRSRRSEVPEELREGWDEAGELSGVCPRVDGQGRRLRE